MLNEWRVDRAEGQCVPCGMNSIRYLGEEVAEARDVFLSLQPGFDAWAQPNPKYGVLLSRWNPANQVYEVMGYKNSAGSFFLKV